MQVGPEEDAAVTRTTVTTTHQRRILTVCKEDRCVIRQEKFNFCYIYMVYKSSNRPLKFGRSALRSQINSGNIGDDSRGCDSRSQNFTLKEVIKNNKYHL